MANRAGDWFEQGERDLRHAVASREDGMHEWACFAAQQAAEKALKAVYMSHGSMAWGHGIAGLLRSLPGGSASQDVVDIGMVLDSYYIPTRYPDAFAQGAPGEHFGDRQSKEAIEHARVLIELARDALAKQD